MAIVIPSGFRISTNEAVDSRLLLSKSEMLNTIDARMPARYFCICTDDGKIYIYNKSCTEPSAETGKFSLYSDDQIVLSGYYLNGKFYTDSTYTVELEKSTKKIYVDQNSAGGLYTWDGTEFQAGVKTATDLIAGVLKLYQNLGQNTDGTVSQYGITNAFSQVQLTVDEEEDECLVLDLPV